MTQKLLDIGLPPEAVAKWLHEAHDRETILAAAVNRIAIIDVDEMVRRSAATAKREGRHPKNEAQWISRRRKFWQRQARDEIYATLSRYIYHEINQQLQAFDHLQAEFKDREYNTKHLWPELAAALGESPCSNTQFLLNRAAGLVHALAVIERRHQKHNQEATG